jgi:hypothetical protein
MPVLGLKVFVVELPSALEVDVTVGDGRLVVG